MSKFEARLLFFPLSLCESLGLISINTLGIHHCLLFRHVQEWIPPAPSAGWISIPRNETLENGLKAGGSGE